MPGAQAPASTRLTELALPLRTDAEADTVTGPSAVECHQVAPASAAASPPSNRTVTVARPVPSVASTRSANRKRCTAVSTPVSPGTSSNVEKAVARSVHSTAWSNTSPLSPRSDRLARTTGTVTPCAWIGSVVR